MAQIRQISKKKRFRDHQIFYDKFQQDPINIQVSYQFWNINYF
jgi:hypothetical protein